MADERKSHLVTESAGPARHQGRTAVHLDAPAAERQRRDRALKASEIRYRRLFETAPCGILVLDAETGIVIDVNPAVCRFLGYEQEEVLEQPLWGIPAFRNAAATKGHFRDLVREAHVRYDDLPIETKDGQIRHIELVSTLFTADSRQFVQCVIHDITARVQREQADGERAQEERLTARANARRSAADETHDRATGLVNRWYLEEALPRELHRAARSKTPLTVSVLVVEQDGALDEAVLREVGSIVREHLRKSDMACRYGDREFILVLPESSPAAAQDRIEQIRSTVKNLELYHGDQQLAGPIMYAGIATAGQDGSTAAELIDAARVAAERARLVNHTQE